MFNFFFWLIFKKFNCSELLSARQWLCFLFTLWSSTILEVCGMSYGHSHVEFRCSCLRMESIGLLCHHLLAIIWYLDFKELFWLFFSKRLRNGTNKCIHGIYPDGSPCWNSQLIARYAMLVHLSREVWACRLWGWGLW